MTLRYNSFNDRRKQFTASLTSVLQCVLSFVATVHNKTRCPQFTVAIVSNCELSLQIEWINDSRIDRKAKRVLRPRRENRLFRSRKANLIQVYTQRKIAIGLHKRNTAAPVACASDVFTPPPLFTTVLNALHSLRHFEQRFKCWTNKRLLTRSISTRSTHIYYGHYCFLWTFRLLL